jgi:hypothetical protein
MAASAPRSVEAIFDSFSSTRSGTMADEFKNLTGRCGALPAEPAAQSPQEGVIVYTTNGVNAIAAATRDIG